MAVLKDGWQEKLSKQTKVKKPRNKSKLEDLACYVYSSGTTGKPKGTYIVVVS